jgi:hypothetical protein
MIIHIGAKGHKPKIKMVIGQSKQKIPTLKAEPILFQQKLIAPEPTVLPEEKLSEEPKVEKRYSTFQLIPHTTIKNDKIAQFADVIGDSYMELMERFTKGKLADPDRIFFETVITNKSYKTYVTTNSDLKDIVKQHARMTWKNVTVKDTELDCYDNLQPSHVMGYTLKLKHHFFLSLKTDKRLQELPLQELLELSRVLDKGDQIIIQMGFQSAEPNWYKEAHEAKNDFEKKTPKWWKKKDFGDPTNLKPGNYGFEFSFRILVYSNDERRKRRISRGVILSYKQLNYDNELMEKQIKPIKMQRFIDDMKSYRIKVPFFFGKRQIISSNEIAHFVKLPQASLQEEYPIIDTINGREIEVPDRLTKEGLKLGVAEFRENRKTVYVPTQNWDELCLPRIVIGQMGQGKTAGFGANLIIESVKNGFGGLAIDPKDGQIRKELELALPPEDIIKVTFGTTPISLDWREVKHSTKAKNRLANTIISFFNTASDEAGPQTARYLRAAVMGMRTGKLSEVVKILEDKEYRQELLCPKHGVLDQLNPMHIQTLEDLNKMSEGKRAQILAPIYNRLDVILGDEYLYECMETDEGIDLVEIISQKKACIIDVPKEALGKEGVEIIVSLISTKLDLAMTLRGEENRFPYMVIFDEPHQFIKSATLWKSAAVESRYWRIAYTWMFHAWEQIPKDLAEIIKSAGPHYHIYPSSKETFSKLKEEIAPFTVEQALKLKTYHTINVIRSGGEVIKPFIAHIEAPPSVKMKKTSSIGSEAS